MLGKIGIKRKSQDTVATSVARFVFLGYSVYDSFLNVHNVVATCIPS